ncbi:reprolysin-like metallopeptidase [Hymenobacter humi]|uniref:Reprolysin-like metallopeptidase n=1 Tax=Hymenobacter humi TaxID=1411620 RepID=A0ABW2U3Z3_9BACT
MRTLRLALAATGEYTQSLGGGTVAGTLATMVTLVNAINAVYERDLSVRMQLVANTDQLIFTNASTDPYDNSSPSALMETNRTYVPATIGAGSFEVGHVLGYWAGGYSGVAYVGVACFPTYSAGGASTGARPASWFRCSRTRLATRPGSSHTFNGTGGSCGGGNREASLAFEPGAGNTLMSYDSRCSPDNVGAGIPYFHAGSISAILPKLTCGTLTATGNRPPSLTVPPSSYTIPTGTPFSLAGSGTDPDGQALTYSWEQMDTGDPTGLAGAAADPSGPPLFRSFAPSASPVRTFPTLTSILNNTTSLGEILPQVARALNFRLTARDNRGGVASANMALTVAASGPFKVTAPAAAFSAAPGSSYNLTWDVQGTNQAPVSCANVQVLFSTDGGNTFPIVLLASTPNDGSTPLQLPRVTTNQGRIKIQAVDNVFFAINNANITIAGSVLPVELSAFTAEARKTTAHLAWTTASEKNNAGFAVEASTDGTVFRRLGWVAGQGNSSSPIRYQFDDGTLSAYPSATVYYRLRQIDTDGTESFSPVRTVTGPVGLVAQLQVWPNPTRGTVSVAGLAPGQVVQLFDLTGRALLTAVLPTSGPLQPVLPSGLAPGFYVISGGGQSRRLAVQ